MLTTEEINAKFESKVKEDKERIEYILANHDLLDDDGYPTEEALEVVERWYFTDKEGWFNFIKSIWWMPDWGWHEVLTPHEYRQDVSVKTHEISTGGWSGNESIIYAMQHNTNFLWTFTWVQSRRGGHYIFEEAELNNG